MGKKNMMVITGGWFWMVVFYCRCVWWCGAWGGEDRWEEGRVKAKFGTFIADIFFCYRRSLERPSFVKTVLKSPAKI